MGKTFIAICMLLGTIIGAGILGIPYVISKSGFLIGFFHLFGVGILVAIIMLYLGEIALRTKKELHLPGYAEKYLGKKGRILMFIALAFGIYSAILAYLIGEGNSLSYLIFNTKDFYFLIAILFWLILSLLLYLDFKIFEGIETIAVTFVFAMIISIVVFVSNKIHLENLSYINENYIFLPFGVVLFAYLAFSIMPEIKRALSEERKKLKSAIIAAYLIAFIIYVLFAFSVIGFRGFSTPEIATIALGRPFIIFGALTMFTAYFALSRALIDTYQYDFKLSKTKSWLLTILIPLGLYLVLEFFQKAEFVKVLGIGGAISGGLTAILILIMARKAKKYGDLTPPYSMPYSIIISILLSIIFILGVITEIINIVK